MKHAGQKSVKEELPERRKGPKRAIECRLKVPTHVWEQDAAGSSPVTSTRFNGMQSICMPFFIACMLFHQDSNLFSIAPRAEAAPNGCVLRVLSPVPRRCGRRIARSDFFKVTSHSLCHSSSSSTTRCAGFLSGMQSICVPFFIACTIFRQHSSLLSIAPRAEPDLPHAAFECIMKENPFLLSGEIS